MSTRRKQVLEALHALQSGEHRRTRVETLQHSPHHFSATIITDRPEWNRSLKI